MYDSRKILPTRPARLLALIALCATAPASLMAQDIDIDFDTDPGGTPVAAGTNLTTDGTYAPWGVTFSRIGGSVCGPDVYANNNHPGDFGSLPNTVSTCAPGTASDINGTIHGQVQASFDFTASQVCIAVRPDDETLRANLTAYDADDQVVDSQDSTVGANEVLCVNGSGIAYVRFPGLGDTNTEYARFDDLQITVEEQASPTATFMVTKTFSDGNTDEVDVTLTCNTGLPLEQTFTIAGGDPEGVTFVVTDIPESGADCAITESGAPGGYTTILNDGAGCSWEDVALGDSYDCAITNSLDSKEVHIIKEWDVDDAGIGSIDPTYRLELYCDGEILGGTFQGESGLWYRELYSGDSLGFAYHDFQPDVYPNWDGGTSCWVNETVYDSAVEVGNGCGTANAPGLLVQISGPEPSCTITNTVFFEGIPTLNQLGLAIMSLLMLGIGFVGLRRLM